MIWYVLLWLTGGVIVGIVLNKTIFKWHHEKANSDQYPFALVTLAKSAIQMGLPLWVIKIQWDFFNPTETDVYDYIFVISFYLIGLGFVTTVLVFILKHYGYYSHKEMKGEK